jgi:hypothetical protein
MIGEGIVALGLLSVVAVAAVAADRRRRRPGVEGEGADEPQPEPAPLPVEDTIGRIDYESPPDDPIAGPEDEPLD